MQKFQEYIKIRESIFTQNDNKSLNPSENNQDSILSNIIILAWKKHSSKVKNLFEKLSSIDPEIASQFDELKRTSNVSDDRERNPFKEKDVIRTPEADSGSSMEEDK